jgi:acetylglutamate/LysW-gamma-L-alpha-aminoadipate kinase
VPGLLRDPSDPDSLIDEATLGDWNELESCAEGNMKRKLLACKEALDAGVPRVILADSRLSRPLSAALSGGGTHIWRTRPFTM